MAAQERYVVQVRCSGTPFPNDRFWPLADLVLFVGAGHSHPPSEGLLPPHIGHWWSGPQCNRYAVGDGSQDLVYFAIRDRKVGPARLRGDRSADAGCLLQSKKFGQSVSRKVMAKVCHAATGLPFSLAGTKRQLR